MVFLFFILFPLAAAASVPGELAKRLVEMRAEVEEAGAAYDDALLKRKAAVEPLQAQYTELQAQVAREELRHAQLREKLKAAGGEKGRDGKAHEWKALESWAGRLTRLVEGSIPFRLSERREKASSLEQRISQKRESPVVVAADLWMATEKELQLTKDVEYRLGKLPLPGGTSEVEIARLGMAHLLYRGPGGSAGYGLRKSGKWELVAARSPSEAGAVDRLMSRLKARSFNGWYEIPGLNSIPREEQE